MDGGPYMLEVRSWSDTPLCTAEDGQDMAAGFTVVVASRRGVMWPVIGGIFPFNKLP